MEKEQQIKLIAGRIIDEYRKHSGSIEDWHMIAASKIHSQWSEHFMNHSNEVNLESIWNEACKAQMNTVLEHCQHSPSGTNGHAIKHWVKQPDFPPHLKTPEPKESDAVLFAEFLRTECNCFDSSPQWYYLGDNRESEPKTSEELYIIFKNNERNNLK